MCAIRRTALGVALSLDFIILSGWAAAMAAGLA